MRSYTKKLTKSTPVYHMSTTSQTRQGSEDPDESETAVQRLQGAKAGQDRQKNGRTLYAGDYIYVYTYVTRTRTQPCDPLPLTYPIGPLGFQLFPSRHARIMHAWHTHDARITGTTPRRSCAMHPSPPTRVPHMPRLHHACVHVRRCEKIFKSLTVSTLPSQQMLKT